ncbi:helix-turn-helix transcriptional regulator [Pseudofrankia sp. DC12]|uniref:helix-turn-helix domain-containing protein n=1 Tax=Pseudofrankia sp. DC12 TaxID=683315 RepID=UPI0005F877C3|nr:helix-turn-helix transcriptional regulator [Pseudofrankia sp. DC12]
MTPRSPRPVTPPDFWQRPEVTEALARRDIGALLKTYQRWTGATQTQIATLCEVPQSHISHILRGKRQVTSLDMYERFANGLDIPRALLGLAETASPTAAPAPPVVLDEPAKPDRRIVLAGAAGAMAAASTDVDLGTAAATHALAFLDRYGMARLDPLTVEQFADDTRRLAIDYMSAAPEAILSQAVPLRARVFAAIDRPNRPDQLRDLHLIAGQLSGILAYATMDVGRTNVAMTNARAALLCADLAGHRDLAVWARGTQSLIARLDGRYTEAARYINAGMELHPTGTAFARLVCGQAQCHANLGNLAGTHKALDAAKHATDQAKPDEFAVGLFGFPRTKVHFYGTSALIWFADRDSARISDREATTAIEMFETGPAEERYVGDELLGHIYQATSRLHLGDVEAARESLRPVLTIPEPQRVEWHRRSLGRMSTLLTTGPYRGISLAADLREEITAF